MKGLGDWKSGPIDLRWDRDRKVWVGGKFNGVYLSNLGVRTERDGLLSLNTTILENELKINPTSLDAIFNSMYSSSSSLLSVSGGSSSKPAATTRRRLNLENSNVPHFFLLSSVEFA